MKQSRCMSLVVSTMLLTSIVMPLFAGYCGLCVSSQPCNISDPACIQRTQLQPTSWCAVCDVEEGGLIYFACTDCFLNRFMCEKRKEQPQPPYASVPNQNEEEWVQCSSPPYRLVVQEENNHRRLDRPYTCIWTGGRYLCQ